jgi:branched-chain amino acid transport system substrate-binding protein
MVLAESPSERTAHEPGGDHVVIKKRLSRHVVVGLAVAIALIAGACGSSSKSPGAASGTTQPAPKGTPIKVGWIGTLTSATVTGPSGGKDAMDAWVQWTNANGGVAGHPVSAVGLAGVKDLIENQHVVAIVGSSAGSTQQTWANYVLEKRIPMVNGSLIDATWFTNAMFYPVGGSVIADIWGMMKSASVAGYKKVGIVLCTEVAACAQAAPLFKSNATTNGLDPVYNTLSSQTQASYTAECLAAKASGAEAMAVFVNNVVFARDCARQGYNPAYINADLGPTLSVIKQAPQFTNIIGSSEEWPCLDSSIPATKDLYAALKSYHPDWIEGGKNHDLFASDICGAWAGGLAFTKAIVNSGVTADAVVTNEDVIKGLAMFKNEDLGGVAAGVTYSDGTKPNPEVKCTFLYTWKDSKFKATVAADGKLYTCRP